MNHYAGLNVSVKDTAGGKMSFAGRRVRRICNGSRGDSKSAVRTRVRLDRPTLLIPLWEGRCADPEEKREPAIDIKRQRDG